MMSVFAERIYKKNYAHERGVGKESWEQTVERVLESVVKPYLPELVNRLRPVMQKRKFMPGGRYLYASGRRYQQLNNCLAGETEVVTNLGVRTLRELVGKEFQVLNKDGVWEKATARSFGRQRLLRVRFKNGDEVLATPNHRWWQADGTRVMTENLKRVPLVMPAEVPAMDEEGIRHGVVFGDGCLPFGANHSNVQFCTKQKEALGSYFGHKEITVEVGNGARVRYQTHRRGQNGRLGVYLQPSHYKRIPDVDTCTPEYARGFIAGLIATDGHVGCSVTIANKSREVIDQVRKLAVLGGCVTTKVFRGSAGKNHINPDGIGPWIVRIKNFSAPLIRPDQAAVRDSKRGRPAAMWQDVESVEDSGRFEEVYCCVVPGSESFTLANGMITSNCFLFRAEDSREGWGELLRKCTSALMTGGGVGVDYSRLRQEDAPIQGMGGKSTGPCALMRIVNEAGRYIMQGGSRRSAIWAGLKWDHPDIFKFIGLKDWSALVREGKKQDYNFAAPMDGTNISVILDSRFFTAYETPSDTNHLHAREVYWRCVRSMLETGEPGFSIDTDINEGENLRNACTEVTSADDSDMCNLGSVNMGRLDSVEEFAEIVEMATGFLMCGTLASQLPMPEMYKVREKNRRLGLGLMGVHEWKLRRGLRYGPSEELGKWLAYYQMSTMFANRYADKLSVSRPVATRAVAPTGTISIVAETTSGVEPIFAVAVKRRFLDGNNWKAQYVIDPTAQRLIAENGVSPKDIEDAVTLADDVERRIEFQAWLQKRVDHGISSTINLPPWGSPLNNENTVSKFGNTLYKYLPGIRGITAYPDGARDGQPLNRVEYAEAAHQLGVEFEDSGEGSCKGGICGS